MKPCIIVKGDDSNIEEFENKIAFAIEQGYEISGDLITHVVDNIGKDVVVLLQPMFLSDEVFEENDEF